MNSTRKRKIAILQNKISPPPDRDCHSENLSRDLVLQDCFSGLIPVIAHHISFSWPQNVENVDL